MTFSDIVEYIGILGGIILFGTMVLAIMLDKT